MTVEPAVDGIVNVARSRFSRSELFGERFSYACAHQYDKQTASMTPVHYDNKAVRIAWWWLLAVAVGITVYIRIRLLDIPLERDEGEYAYSGQLILHGIPPWKLAYTMKLPGTAVAYAFFISVFGQTTAGIHVGLLLVNLASIAALLLLGRELAGLIPGLAAACTYAVLSITRNVLGLAAHATHFVVLTLLVALWVLTSSKDQLSIRRCFLSGLILGLGVLMKQPAIIFVIFGSLYLCVYRPRLHPTTVRRCIKQVVAFASGTSAPLFVTGLVVWWTGVFGNFRFWTIDYAQEYCRLVSPSQGLNILSHSLPSVIGYNWPIWLIAGLGTVTCVLTKTAAFNVFLLAFFSFSALAVCPGFYFRPHYFVLLLPALSLMVGVAVSWFMQLPMRRLSIRCALPFLLVGTALGWTFASDRQFFFSLSPVDACRKVYLTNPFPESEAIASYLRDHTAERDTIAVLGSEPQIYFYSHRRSATGYIYTYPLMEPQKYNIRMQHEMIREIETARPVYLVFVATNRSWQAGRTSERLIFEWANDYCAENYTVVGLVNIALTGTSYYLGDIPQAVKPYSNHILIYKRRYS